MYRFINRTRLPVPKRGIFRSIHTQIESSLQFHLNSTHIQVNKNQVQDTSLIEFLRAQGLTGTKLGCGAGQCGACTVVLEPSVEDDSYRTVNACLTPVLALQNERIQTVEGIGTVVKPHEVQKRISELHGSQCGFCSPGMVYINLIAS